MGGGGWGGVFMKISVLIMELFKVEGESLLNKEQKNCWDKLETRQFVEMLSN